ncbi:PRC-barrel domain-containing protein [Okeania sp.]|uniref:PRC-barrel domain-containing protein n=1 Tax=Okeania sp. TaxID=3100323 RepID=UPI002B4AE005|nr:PRC-barrel domain-containing protein [Okeania sp.]MEB3341757.1 PRC-barrel domain-containing protein [Okeania sp.]
MNEISELIKHSQLLKRLVLDRETVEEQGYIKELCLDPQSHQVIGFICQSGFLGKQKKYFAWTQIETIGTDAILVNDKPQPDNWEKENNTINIIGNEVLTDTGEKVGSIVEYILNIKTGAVVHYLFKSNGWQGVLDGIYLLAPEVISSTGKKRVIVVNSAVENPECYTEGVAKKLGLFQNFLQEDLVKTREHIDIARSEAKKLASGIQEKAIEVKKQAQEKAEIVKKQAQEKVEDFQTNEINRKIQTNTEKFTTKMKQLTTEAKEKIDGVKSQPVIDVDSVKSDSEESEV